MIPALNNNLKFFLSATKKTVIFNQVSKNQQNSSVIDKHMFARDNGWEEWIWFCLFFNKSR